MPSVITAEILQAKFKSHYDVTTKDWSSWVLALLL